MKIQKVSPLEVAAYNHGYCYCVTYAQRKAINIADLNQASAHFYAAKSKLRSMFESGYMVALNDVNTGKVNAASLGPNCNSRRFYETR